MELQNTTIPQGKEITNFMLYASSSACQNNIKDMLFAEVADIRENFQYKELPQLSAQQVCQYHRQHYPDSNKHDIHASIFLLFDSEEPNTSGILLVDLTNDSGYADAVRCLPSEAALGAAALAMGSNNWQTIRQTAFAAMVDGPATPSRFALYILNGSALPTRVITQALSRIDRGIHDLDIYEYQESGRMQSTEAEGNDHFYGFRYDIITPDNKSSTVEDITENHISCATAKGLDTNYFVVFDNKYEQDGLIIVQTASKDQFRCRGLPAGELVWWTSIGFATWQEVKDFARRYNND